MPASVSHSETTTVASPADRLSLRLPLYGLGGGRGRRVLIREYRGGRRVGSCVFGL